MAQAPGTKGTKTETAVPPAARLHVWQFQAVRDVLVFGAFIGMIWAGYAMRAVTVPLLVALVLAYIFEPLVARLTRNPKTSRPLVVGGLLVTVGLLFILALTFTIPLVVGQTVQFVENLRAGRFRNTIIQAQEFVPEQYRGNYEKAVRWLVPDLASPTADGMAAATAPATGADSRPDSSLALPNALSEERIRDIVRQELAEQRVEPAAPMGSTVSVMGLVRGGGEAALSLLGTVAQLGLLAFLIPFYFFFFSVSYPAVVRFGRSLIPVTNRTRAFELIAKMDRAVAGFVRGRIVISALIALMLAIGWMICKVPYAIPLGLLVGVFSIVPYLAGVGIPLAVGLLALSQVELPPEQRMVWWAIILGPVVVYIIVQVVETYIFTPLIAGKATNLDPVTILVVVLAGGSVGGVYGMILAIPVAACAKILITDVLLPRIKQWVKGEAEDMLPIS